MARAHPRRELPARPVPRCQGGRARQPVHLRQLSADRVSRSLVLRPLRVQRLPASRGGAARVPRAAAARRRSQAAAAGRGRRGQHPRRRRRSRPRSPRCTSARLSKRARAARSRSHGPTSGGAAAIRSTTGRSAWSIATATRSPQRSPSPPRSSDAPFPREVRADMAARLGRRLRLQRRRHARRLPRLARRSDVPRLRGHPRQRRIEGSDGRDRARPSRGCGSSTSPNGGLSAARNVGLAEATGEIVAYTDADMRVDPRLADVSRSAVPDLRRRRLRRAQRRPGRRSADGAVHRARAGRADARAARRPHRRARARLQHGVPPRGAARHRRLQSHLPARGRRCGRVLAAAGAGREDRVLAARRSSGTTIGPR